MSLDNITFEVAFKYLTDKGVTAYELHKFSGASEAGFRKLLNGNVDNPRRKTKDILIDYYKSLVRGKKLTITEKVDSELLSQEQSLFLDDLILNHEKALLNHGLFKTWLNLKLAERENEIHREYTNRDSKI
ncbi:hypothetical protein BTO06_00255 [Tenacibaculum sp. SZ-18]|uniref:hypothetical protein n=1 Tax=Tenacibaculum sp. SZ-18 TaxID=754423 RepID=UPI000C2D47E2|nr:hypothetical protein [Tenacibaculum sp. SZ-18]AUC13669.1 hypothetical protein BTO06_00255 [Tenacibaculum sp. SZ-18]